MDKKELRRQMAALRRTYSDAEADSARIFGRLCSLEGFRNAGTVLLYHSIPGEVCTHDWFDRMPQRIVLPLVDGDRLLLKLYSPDRLREGYRGILEPSPEAEDVPAGEIDFAVVPGVAFDRSCHRLGRGGGYYDRLLPLLDCPTCGVGFGFQIVGEVPCDSWDMPLDIIVTPTETILK